MKRILLIVTALIINNINLFCDYREWRPTGELPTGNVEAMLFNEADNTLLIAVYGAGVYISDNLAESWTESNTGLDNLLIKDMLMADNGDIYLATNGGGVYKSTDKAATWSAVNEGLDNIDVLCLAENIAGDIFAGTWFGGHVYRTQDSGANWDELGVNGDIHAIICIGSDTILAGTQNLGIYKSVNGGESWLSSGMSGKDTYCFMALPDGNILSGNSQGLFMSTDRGGNWKNMGLGIGGARIGALATDPYGNIFAGSYDDNGVYISSDSAQNWETFNNSFPETWVYSLVSDSSGNIFAGTGNGVWYAYNEPESAEDNMPGFAESSVKAFPNPFFNSVNFRIDNIFAGTIQLEIYDCIGNIVYQKEFPQMDRIISWEPENLATGTYFYKIKSGSSIFCDKIIYMQ